MKNVRIVAVAAVIVTATLHAPSALAAVSAASASLEKCQKAAHKNAAGYTADLQKLMAGCLLKIAEVVVKEDPAGVDVSGATKACLSKFHKIGRADAKSVDAKVSEKLAEACDSVSGDFEGEHDADDVLGTGSPNVDQPLDANANLDGYCAFFGSGATTVSGWIDCIKNAAVCEANQQIALQFPRAIEWLTAMDAEFDAANSNKVAEAQPALQAVLAAIDTDEDGVADIKCGPGAIPGVDPIIPVTGMTLCYDDAGDPIACAGTGQDGELQFGRPLAFTDNGDGTITDLNTGLVWEKKSDDDSIHDKDATYSFEDASAVHAATLNAMTFAGYDDWRVPNVKELTIICDYSRPNSAALPVEFNNGCTGGCTVTTCSCPIAGFRWTSTPNTPLPSLSWTIASSDCDHAKAGHTVARGVRAVRGGP